MAFTVQRWHKDSEACAVQWIQETSALPAATLHALQPLVEPILLLSFAPLLCGAWQPLPLPAAAQPAAAAPAPQQPTVP